MPYISQEARLVLDQYIPYFTANIPDGHINYFITRIIDQVYGSGGYAEFNRALGVLEAVKLEFYRRRVAPYEDKKIKANGDVYGQDD